MPPSSNPPEELGKHIEGVRTEPAIQGATHFRDALREFGPRQVDIGALVEYLQRTEKGIGDDIDSLGGVLKGLLPGQEAEVDKAITDARREYDIELKDRTYGEWRELVRTLIGLYNSKPNKILSTSDLASAFSRVSWKHRGTKKIVAEFPGFDARVREVFDASVPEADAKIEQLRFEFTEFLKNTGEEKLEKLAGNQVSPLISYLKAVRKNLNGFTSTSIVSEEALRALLGDVPSEVEMTEVFENTSGKAVVAVNDLLSDGRGVEVIIGGKALYYYGTGVSLQELNDHLTEGAHVVNVRSWKKDDAVALLASLKGGQKLRARRSSDDEVKVISVNADGSLNATTLSTFGVSDERALKSNPLKYCYDFQGLEL